MPTPFPTRMSHVPPRVLVRPAGPERLPEPERPLSLSQAGTCGRPPPADRGTAVPGPRTVLVHRGRPTGAQDVRGPPEHHRSIRPVRTPATDAGKLRAAAKGRPADVANINSILQRIHLQVRALLPGA